MNSGSVGKLFFRFESPWWHVDPTSPFGLHLAWGADGKLDADIDPQDWTRGIDSFSEVRGHDDLLLVWVDGIRSRAVEDMSDEKVK